MDKINLNKIIGKRLRVIRTERQISLDKLAEMTGVSKPMLGQIERGESNPTVGTLWKIANGLQVPFTTFIEEETPRVKLVRRDHIEPLREESGQFHVTPLFPKETGKPFECFSVTLNKGCHYQSEAHASGVEEYVFVEKGTLTLTVANHMHHLHVGDAIQFAAHFEHTYRNETNEDCIVTMMIFYR
ncbi:helix-turn-helix domain-containing protein [Bacillus alkalicellulosilyticus]|uniref:helix-turn-helix domain-containing protein n=1 Tax=Alkalihalobacterium alkalicellulosilyticum TaxID=1912214 RepID=UPI000998B35A|nr:XRE family transcriptional regulator [Bacillus alkalicellulosilyticus]